MANIAEKMMDKWDSYIQKENLFFSILSEQKTIPFFKKKNEESYKLFRELMQMVDLSLLSVKTLQYSSKLLIASTMFLVLSRNFNQYTNRDILSQFSSLSFLKEKNYFNNVYDNFIKFFFNDVKFAEDLSPVISFISKFFNLNFDYEIPNFIDFENIQSVISLNKVN